MCLAPPKVLPPATVPSLPNANFHNLPDQMNKFSKVTNDGCFGRYQDPQDQNLHQQQNQSQQQQQKQQQQQPVWPPATKQRQRQRRQRDEQRHRQEGVRAVEILSIGSSSTDKGAPEGCLDSGVDASPRERKSTYGSLLMPTGSARRRSMMELAFHMSPENKLAVRALGSKRAVAAEMKRQEELQGTGSCFSACVIHPYSPFRWYWDMTMVLLLGCTVVTVPLIIAFIPDCPGGAWFTIWRTVDFFFVGDVVINFFTGVATAEVRSGGGTSF